VAAVAGACAHSGRSCAGAGCLQLFKLESYSLNSTEAYMDDLASKATFRQTSYIIFSILFVSLGMAMIENAPTESLLTLEWHFLVLMGFTSLLLIVPWLYRTNLKVQQKERNRLIGVVHPASEPAKDDFEARTHLNPGAAASYGTAAPSTVELAAKVAMPMNPTPREDIADNMDGFLLEPELVSSQDTRLARLVIFPADCTRYRFARTLACALVLGSRSLA